MGAREERQLELLANDKCHEVGEYFAFVTYKHEKVVCLDGYFSVLELKKILEVAEWFETKKKEFEIE